MAIKKEDKTMEIFGEEIFDLIEDVVGEFNEAEQALSERNVSMVKSSVKKAGEYFEKLKKKVEELQEV